MSQFVQDLWMSIFTPGPTSTLLVATNVAFAALQMVFLALLIATYSIHFIILSFLCGGLWWAINWFAAEVRVAQAQQEEQALREKETSGLIGRSTEVEGDADAELEDGADRYESGEDTEMEVSQGRDVKMQRVRMSPTISNDVFATPFTSTEESVNRTPTATRHARFPSTASEEGSGPVWHTGAAARLAPPGVDVRQRRSMGDSTELSTDSEWEKVEEGQ